MTLIFAAFIVISPFLDVLLAQSGVSFFRITPIAVAVGASYDFRRLAVAIVFASVVFAGASPSAEAAALFFAFVPALVYVARPVLSFLSRYWVNGILFILGFGVAYASAAYVVVAGGSPVLYAVVRAAGALVMSVLFAFLCATVLERLRRKRSYEISFY